jgi:Transglycosylase SLT domain
VIKTLSVWLTILALYVVLVVPAGAQGYEEAIYTACAHYGCSGDQLVRVANCESGMNPNAIGIHGEVGLFQFMDYTYYAHGGTNLYNPWEQIDVAARMWANGLGYMWVCQ